MFTVILARIHSKSTNPKFDPEGLYALTFIIDVFLMIFGVPVLIGSLT